MKKKMFFITAIISFLFCLSIILYNLFSLPFIFTVTITLGTASYHFIMRLLVGYSINAIFKNKVDCEKWWFKEKKFEKGLYKFLKVKVWKKKMPTFSPHDFSLKDNSLEFILGASCQAEIVHEVIAVLSFLPIALIPIFNSPVAFILTSLLSAIFDLSFAIIQRFNRPRFLSLAKKRYPNQQNSN